MIGRLVLTDLADPAMAVTSVLQAWLLLQEHAGKAALKAGMPIQKPDD